MKISKRFKRIQSDSKQETDFNNPQIQQSINPSQHDSVILPFKSVLIRGIRVTLMPPLLSAFKFPGNSTSIPDAASRVNSTKFDQIRPKKYFESACINEIA